jgi:rsbT co-antagonist protein RsbR
MEPKPIRGVGLRWALLDALGLRTLETFQKSREEVIIRQQREIAGLSTPVVKLWEGILALPLIRTLDSQRTQVIMESFMRRSMEMPRSPCRKR